MSATDYVTSYEQPQMAYSASPNIVLLLILVYFAPILYFDSGIICEEQLTNEHSVHLGLSSEAGEVD